ncbi:uncharacterized protein LOC113849620 isoform X3 [Abrus precatorius]|uniref:Uncharacterized protein LOC113849620 isoform X3 n=1 Tax=Abrus precatorius TaxID=3816 RepID=A0A8B8JXR1_ABRPR|nr:uncharacterized protein LOC113849620 isoform X3 [Abrus precatorius]
MAIQAFHGSSCCFRSHLYSSFSSSTTASPSLLATRRFQSYASTRKSLKLNCSSSGNNDDQCRIIFWMLQFLLEMDSLSVEENIQMSLVRVMNGLSKGKWLTPIQFLALVKRLKIQFLDSPWELVLKLLVIFSGFGFSDKPQPRYGFDYTLDEYVTSFGSLIDELAVANVSLVVQGYFSPIVVKYASTHQEKLSNLILLNPPLTALHAKLPSTLSIFSNFLLGEIFSQDPLRASDKALTSCGPYKMKEEDAMVYRRPYLTSGSSGFALNAISRNMKKDLKRYVEDMQTILKDQNWKVRTSICWGQRDRWLSYDGVEDFCKDSNHTLIEVPMAGHHVQEDGGEEVGQLIYGILSKRK